MIFPRFKYFLKILISEIRKTQERPHGHSGSDCGHTRSGPWLKQGALGSSKGKGQGGQQGTRRSGRPRQGAGSPSGAHRRQTPTEGGRWRSSYMELQGALMEV